MKTKNNIPAAILAKPTKDRNFEIRIDLGTSWVKIKTNDYQMAMEEFHRYRTASVFGGRWIKEIIMDEL